VEEFVRKVLGDKTLGFPPRAEAIKAISKVLPKKRAISLLIKLLNDKNYFSFEDVIVCSFAGLGKDSVKPLIENLNVVDLYVRLRTVRTLGQLGPIATAAVPKLRGLGEVKNRELRFEINRALDRIGG
jgi:HEAT repeat protein